MAPKQRKGQSAKGPSTSSGKKSASKHGSQSKSGPFSSRSLSGVAAASLVGLLASGAYFFCRPEAQTQATITTTTTSMTTHVDDKEVGWDQGDGGLSLLSADLLGSGVDQMSLPGVEVPPTFVSASPRIFAFDDLLSPEECRYLISLAKGRLKPAGVVVETTDKYKREEQWRNNEQIWLTPDEERKLPLLQHILKRMHRIARVPDTDAEGLQIGRYVEGQKYEVHQDSDPGHDVLRPATMIVYLSDVDAGGETLFPKDVNCPAEWQVASDGSQKFGCAHCCQEPRPGTLLVRPKIGRAVLFFNHLPDGQKDLRAMHAACPIVRGTKWIIQRWFRLKPYQNVRFRDDPRFDGIPQFLPAPDPNAGCGWSGRVRILRQKAPRIYLLDSFTSASDVEKLKALALSRFGASDSALDRLKVDLKEEAELDETLPEVSNNLSIAAYLPGHVEAIHFLRAGSTTRSVPTVAQHAIAWLFLGGGEADLVFPLKAKCGAAGGDCCTASADAEGLLKVPAVAGRAILMYQDKAGELANGLLCPSRSASASAALLLLEQRFSPKQQQQQQNESPSSLPDAYRPASLTDLASPAVPLIL